MSPRAGWLGLVLLCALARPASAAAPEVVIAAAISVREAVTTLGRIFAAQRPEVILRYAFASSGDLQKQIEAGAPVDLFIAAGEAPMDALARRQLIVRGSRRNFARNVLVAVTPIDARIPIGRPADLLQPAVRRIVIGNPRTVPAGQYAAEALRTLGLWDALRPKLVLAENVRQALEYVSRGEVDAGFVYATDGALRRDRVREAFRPPPESHGPIVYPVAVVVGARHPALAGAFIDALLGPEGQAILGRLGFETVAPRAARPAGPAATDLGAWVRRWG